MALQETDDTYKTIAGECRGSFRDKGSRFLAFAYPVASEEEVKERLAFLRKEYYDARHHCYAYRIGFENHSYRINDDGEPSGTAGRPVFGQILSHDLTQVLIVVIRYFGGIKLGVPGLINAYRSAATDALTNGEIITRQIREVYCVRFDYLAMNSVMKALKDEHAEILSQGFDDACILEFSIRKNCGKKISERLMKISNVSLSLQQVL